MYTTALNRLEAKWQDLDHGILRSMNSLFMEKQRLEAKRQELMHFELPWKVTRFEAWRQDHENLVLLINS